MIEIPLTASPEQLFSVTLGGENYDVRVALNSRTGVWSISLGQEGTPIVEGVAMVGGVDIFAPYNIPIANAYVVNLDNTNLDPARDDLGTVSQLFILTDDEVSGG